MLVPGYAIDSANPVAPVDDIVATHEEEVRAVGRERDRCWRCPQESPGSEDADGDPFLVSDRLRNAPPGVLGLEPNAIDYPWVTFPKG